MNNHEYEKNMNYTNCNKHCSNQSYIFKCQICGFEKEEDKNQNKKFGYDKMYFLPDGKYCSEELSCEQVLLYNIIT
jgi:hypothetical protein